jgi:hypothetical protein
MVKLFGTKTPLTKYMKKIIIIGLLAISTATFAQDVIKNGIVYKRHLCIIYSVKRIAAEGGSARFVDWTKLESFPTWHRPM